MKRLTDLYARGKPVLIEETDDAGETTGDSVIIYVAKINPVDQEEAVRAGSARQAVVLAAGRDHTSQQWLAIVARALTQAPADLIEQLVNDEREKQRPVCESMISFEDEWKKEGYLEGLRDAWDTYLRARFEATPEDPDAKRVHDELVRFFEQVDQQLLAETNPLRRDLMSLTPERLQERWCDEELKMRATVAFNLEFYRYALAAAVREPCPSCMAAIESGEKHASETSHPRKYFSGPDEINALDIRLRSQLQRAYNDITVGPTEGKGSPPRAASSASSVPAGQGATVASSGQTDVAA